MKINFINSMIRIKKFGKRGENGKTIVGGFHSSYSAWKGIDPAATASASASMVSPSDGAVMEQEEAVMEPVTVTLSLVAPSAETVSLFAVPASEDAMEVRFSHEPHAKAALWCGCKDHGR